MTPNKAGRYELQEELGRGAMGVVYKAYDPMIGRTVAVKTLRLTEAESGLEKPELVQRFQNETRAAGLLSHSNIVTIYDAGEDAGLFFITMEYVEGRSLQHYMEERRAFPLRRVLRIMEQACAALEYAHQRNVVHRDVKPANMLLGPGDTLKITDFGTAKILQMGTTQTGNIIGTPSYMSPEQVKGKPIDGRTDVFSLGVILYEMVTGEKPFPGTNVTTVIYKIVHEDPISPREIDSSVHPGLNQVITRALAKDAAARFQSCGELLEALKNYRNFDAPVAVRSEPPPPPPSETPDFSSAATVVMAPPPAVRGPVPEPPRPAPPPAQAPPAPPPPRETPASPAPAPRPAPRPLHLQLPESAPRKSGAVWMTVLLLAVLGAVGYFIWPLLQEMAVEQGWMAAGTPPAEQAASPEPAPPAAERPAPPPPAPPETAPAERAETKAEPPPAAAKIAPEPGPPAKAAPPDYAAIQQRIEQRLAEAGMAGRVRVERRGDSFALRGELTAAERRELLPRLRGVSGPVRLEDRIETVRAPAEERPRAAPGRGEIEVITSVAGATVVLRGPEDRVVGTRRTPTRFEELPAGRYTMEVTLAGFRTVRQIVELRSGQVVSRELTLEPSASGLVIQTRPPGVEIHINGQPRAERTPATIFLSPGRYTVTLVAEGFQRSTHEINLGENELPTLTVTMARAPGQGLGYVVVRTVPVGAGILLGSRNTGNRTPYTLELPAGEYELVLHLAGYVTVRRPITVVEGQTVTINEVLTRSP